MKKFVKVLFVPVAEEIYQHLSKNAYSSKSNSMLLSAIDTKIAFLKEDCYYGNPIAKHLIPIEYIIAYNAKNLFRVELPLFWRMLYTLTNDEEYIIVMILDIIDHKTYNKKFGYKKN